MIARITEALVVANGDSPSAELVRELAERKGRMVVAADGGADRALALGITPDVIVGDLDSVSREAAQALRRPSDLVHDPDPDSTDLEKAIRWCLRTGITSIDVVCAGGGRADHALGNLSLLAKYGRQAEMRFIDDQFETTLVNGTASVEGPSGTVVSLIAIGRCHGVTTVGLRWPLHDYSMSFSPYGIHNEIAESPASVSVRSGDLLLFRGRWVEKHG
jgi:thiamine pyrophosphokinase